MDDDLRRRMASVVTDLQERSDLLNGALVSARAENYDAESPDRQVHLSVDGRPRVTGVHITARAIREYGAEGLGAVLTQVLNEGLAEAHAGTQRLLQPQVPGALIQTEGHDR
jgi:hypothetical protein